MDFSTLQILNSTSQFMATDIGVFLYGSQNYGLDTDKSDYDLIKIVLESPTPRQEFRTVTGILKIYTLEYFIKRLQRGDMECYEILCTPYRKINPIYENIWYDCVDQLLSVIDYALLYRALRKKLIEHFDHILWIKKGTDKRYNRKRLYWAIRVHNQINLLLEGITFADSLKYSGEYDLKSIKENPGFLCHKDFNEIYNNLKETIYNIPFMASKKLDYSKYFQKLYDLKQGGCR